MIDPKELRIGNLVAVPRKMSNGFEGFPVTVKVETIGTKGINQWQDMGSSGEDLFYDIIPIPLTHEIFIRCGFKRMCHEDFPENGNFIKEYPVTYQDAPERFIVWDNYLSKHDWLLDGYSAAPIKYLHQLQNLYFALTGEDLYHIP